MCKLLILQKHLPSRRDHLIESAWEQMCALGERDGFGAAWITKDGRLAWRKSSSPLISGQLPAWADSFEASRHAEMPSDGGWLLIHGRTATCGVNLENTHPMLDNGRAALVHNGVVRSDSIHNVETTCDSELLLRAWDQGGAKSLDQITGYFAFGLLIRRRDGWHAVVAKGDSAKLRIGHHKKFGWAWGTNDDVLEVAGVRGVASQRAMTACVFAPDGSCDIQKFSKGREKITSLARSWEVASGARHASAWNGELFASGGER